MLRHSLSAIFGLTLLLILVVRCGPPPLVEPESLRAVRPAYDGYSLAVPLVSPREFTDRLPAVEFALQPINLILEITAKGGVATIEPVDSIPLRQWNEIVALLKQIQFYPGQRLGKRVKQRLPVYLLLAPQRHQRRIDFPVGPDGSVTDSDLYWRGMQLNGVDLPFIERFGSYFLDVDKEDTSATMQYLLARLTFDSTGRVTERDLLHSDFGPFSAQILDAANWGEYHLPKRNDQKPQSAYLRVAKLRSAADPSKLFDAKEVDNLDLPERERVRLFPDTVGLLFKPIPIRYQNDGIFHLLGGKMAITDTLFAKITIDSIGRVANFDPVGAAPKQKNDYLKLMTWIRFHPALGFDGRPCQFTGVMEFAYEGSTMLRIRFLWLPYESLAY